jgi:hypothetical protein
MRQLASRELAGISNSAWESGAPARLALETVAKKRGLRL